MADTDIYLTQLLRGYTHEIVPPGATWVLDFDIIREPHARKAKNGSSVTPCYRRRS